jgi:Protein of unknown function (DUF1559)
MSEPSSDFTNGPKRGNDGSASQPPHPAYEYECTPDDDLDRPAIAEPPRTLFSTVLVGLVVGALVMLACGLLLPAVSRVRGPAMRLQSLNNLKQMGIALMNIAENTKTGSIPPAYGPFPPGQSQPASFFQHLLPYIEYNSMYSTPTDAPVKPYIAPADPFNPGTNSTISYCTNATLLSGQPCYPALFNGRSSASLICVMERSGLNGAHKWTNDNNSLGSPGAPPLFPQLDTAPATYLDGCPQGFSSSGCQVALGDGSARSVTKKQWKAWNWACDPADQSPAPADW